MGKEKETFEVWRTPKHKQRPRTRGNPSESVPDATAEKTMKK